VHWHVALVLGYIVGSVLFPKRDKNKEQEKQIGDLTEIKNALVYYNDFPSKGVKFVDIHPLMMNERLRNGVLHLLKQRYQNKGITAIAAMESRGYYFGLPLAIEWGI